MTLLPGGPGLLSTAAKYRGVLAGLGAPSTELDSFDAFAGSRADLKNAGWVAVWALMFADIGGGVAAQAPRAMEREVALATERSAAQRFAAAQSLTEQHLQSLLDVGATQQGRAEGFVAMAARGDEPAFLSGTPSQSVSYGSTELSRFAQEYRRLNNYWTGNVAVFDVIDPATNARTLVPARNVTAARGVTPLHSEANGSLRLSSLGLPKENVVGVYSELQPCTLNFANCQGMLAREFPQANVTFSFEYGPTVESRERGVSLLQQALELVRSR